MLLNDFYMLSDLSDKPSGDGGTITASIAINKSHKIFEGHFPGLPIVPGVCMMQMIKEIMEFRLHKKLIMKEADQVKFLSVINPGEYSLVMTEIQFKSPSEGEIEIVARLFYENITFFKLKARLSNV